MSVFQKLTLKIVFQRVSFINNASDLQRVVSMANRRVGCCVKGCDCQEFRRILTAQEASDERRGSRDNTNKWVKRVAIGGVAAVGGAILAPIAVPAALGVIGFGSGGVVGGSVAAAWMSSIGNVAAGSLFATLQSVGAAGLGAAGTAAGAAASGVAGVAAASAVGVGKDDDDKNKENCVRCCDCFNPCINCQHCKCKHTIANDSDDEVSFKPLPKKSL